MTPSTRVVFFQFEIQLIGMVFSDNIKAGRQRALIFEDSHVPIEVFNDHGDSFESPAIGTEYVGVGPFADHGVGGKDDALRKSFGGQLQSRCLARLEPPRAVG